MRLHGFGAIAAAFSGGIRPYGHGKFYDVVDTFIYELALEGSDSETGESEGPGYFWLVKLGPQAATDIDEYTSKREHGYAKSHGGLTDEERKLVVGSKFAILRENNDGFVAAEYYSDEAEAKARWAHIEKNVASFYED